MSALRLLGAVLIVLSGGATGLLSLREARNRAALLAEMIVCLRILKEEIDQRQRPLSEAFAMLGQSRVRTVGAFFSELSEGVGAQPLHSLWSAGVARLSLPPEALAALHSLGGVLGRFEGRQQAEEIETVCLRLEKLWEIARREADRRRTTYPGLGLSMGAMLAVILL